MLIVRGPQPVAAYERFWEKVLVPPRVPRLLRGAPVQPLLPTDEEILDQLKQLGARARAGEKVPITLNIEGDDAFRNMSVAKTPPFVLGQPEDVSLEDFYRRVRKRLGDKRFQIYAPALLSASQAIEMRRFARPRIGLVGTRYLLDAPMLFIGDYNSGFYGVHVDDFVFVLPLHGRKAIRLWDDDYVSENPDLRNAVSFEKHKETSTLLEGGRGDAIFWPERYWHVNGTEDRKFRVSMSIRCKANDSPAGSIATAQFARLCRAVTSSADAGSLEEVVSESIAQLNVLYDLLEEHKAHSVKELLRLISGDGLTVPHRPHGGHRSYEDALDYGESIALSPDCTFLCLEQRDTLIVAVNGNVVSIPYSVASSGLLNRLANDDPVSLADIDSEYGGFDAEAIRVVLRLLMSAGAIARCEQ